MSGASCALTFGAAGSPKYDPLGQRQLFGIIDRDGLAAHIGLPGIAAAFTTAPGFLFPAERAADFSAAGPDVDVGNAAVAAAAGEKLPRLAEVVGENRRAESLRNFIVPGDGFVEGGIRDNVEKGREGFLVDDFLVVPRGDQAGANITAARIRGPVEWFAPVEDLAT